MRVTIVCSSLNGSASYHLEHLQKGENSVVVGVIYNNGGAGWSRRKNRVTFCFNIR